MTSVALRSLLLQGDSALEAVGCEAFFGALGKAKLDYARQLCERNRGIGGAGEMRGELYLFQMPFWNIFLGIDWVRGLRHVGSESRVISRKR